MAQEVGSLAAAVSQLPAELAEAVDKLLMDSVEAGSFLKRNWKGKRGYSRYKTRETTEERRARISGEEDLLNRLAEHFSMSK